MKHPLCFYVVACLMAALLFISSCAREYDLSDGNLDMNIQIGGDSLTLPLGSTGQIMISDFLYVEEFENLKVSEDEIKDLEGEIQKLTDKYIKDIEKAVDEKSKEILTV